MESKTNQGDNEVISARINFRKFIQGASSKLPEKLPLVHITSTFAARSILEQGRFKPGICKRFTSILGKEELLCYFFYGRPAYRLRDEESGELPSGAHPTAFVLSVEEPTNPIKRVFPFDSGAMIDRKYEQFIHSQMGIMDFLVGEDFAAAQKNVAKFYKTNKNYLENKAISSLKIDCAEFEVEGYYNLIKNELRVKIDDRKNSIEVQFPDAISLSTAKIHAWVVPEALLGSTSLTPFTEKYGIKLVPYVLNQGGSMEAQQAVLISKTNEFIKGILK